MRINRKLKVVLMRSAFCRGVDYECLWPFWPPFWEQLVTRLTRPQLNVNSHGRSGDAGNGGSPCVQNSKEGFYLGKEWLLSEWMSNFSVLVSRDLMVRSLDALKYIVCLLYDPWRIDWLFSIMRVAGDNGYKMEKKLKTVSVRHRLPFIGSSWKRQLPGREVENKSKSHGNSMVLNKESNKGPKDSEIQQNVQLQPLHI